MTATDMLVIDGVAAGYGGGRVVDGLDLRVRSGAISVLLGRNGVGKTTAVRAVAGLLAPLAGRVGFDGQNITGLSASEIARRGLSVLPQGKRIFPSLTVDENLEMGLMARRRRERAGADTSLGWSRGDVIDRFERLGERARVAAASLSGGEQQMLAFARLMVSGPRVLLLDEPSEALSPARVAELGDLLDDLRSRGMTVLLVEQNLSFALRLADHVAVMEKGRIAHEVPGDVARDGVGDLEALLAL